MRQTKLQGYRAALSRMWMIMAMFGLLTMFQNCSDVDLDGRGLQDTSSSAGLMYEPQNNR